MYVEYCRVTNVDTNNLFFNEQKNKNILKK